MGLADLFHKDDKRAEEPSENQATPGAISGDSSVAEWLAHPVGGQIFRSMLAEAGQSEGVLRPVKRMSLKKLVSMSNGRFTEDQLNDMVTKANSGETPAATAPLVTESPSQTTVATPVLPEWSETITPGRFNGKTVIVTGAGSGIGRATASRVAREGGRVIAVDISEERLAELKTSLPDIDITTVTANIIKEDDIKRVVEVAGEKIDALANVAGIMDNMTPLHEVADEIWDRVLAVNVTGMMRLSRAVIPFMLKQNKGSIVNVGSEASLRGSAAGAAYTASKHAVVGLTKSSAFMYGPSGIRFNIVAPGAVMTNIQASFDSELGSERVNMALGVMPDAATAEELAASITFLLSDDGVNINGAVLASDGGWSAV